MAAGAAGVGAAGAGLLDAGHAGRDAELHGEPHVPAGGTLHPYASPDPSCPTGRHRHHHGLGVRHRLC